MPKSICIIINLNVMVQFSIANYTGALAADDQDANGLQLVNIGQFLPLCLLKNRSKVEQSLVIITCSKINFMYK